MTDDSNLDHDNLDPKQLRDRLALVLRERSDEAAECAMARAEATDSGLALKHTIRALAVLAGVPLAEDAEDAFERSRSKAASSLTLGGLVRAIVTAEPSVTNDNIRGACKAILRWSDDELEAVRAGDGRDVAVPDLGR